MVDHYYTNNMHGPLNPFTYKVRLKSDTYEILSAQGIFSKSELDNASKLLIETTLNTISGTESILDLGCGNGVVGVSLKRQYPNLHLTFIDVNKRALALTKKNIKQFKFKLCETYLSNIFDKIPNSKFDLILTNPPYSAGRDVCIKFISDSFKHLNAGGKLFLVARHNKGGKYLSNIMFDVFDNMEEVDKKSGFRVYASILNPSE